MIRVVRSFGLTLRGPKSPAWFAVLVHLKGDDARKEEIVLLMNVRIIMLDKVIFSTERCGRANPVLQIAY